ncbi:hypothetical protein PIB30_034865 [Stylosanthes scabra]|uniref:Uncharacterized protein n=1 Tax=Stylosanthes scabra TaxID=79078 RepID=A0ABU6QCB3_9FABA|nr:hypothetical protein [Stylosanthes scabra]
MLNWAVELSQFDIKFRPWTTIEAQAMSDLLAEMAMIESSKGEYRSWKLHVDKSSTQSSAQEVGSRTLEICTNSQVVSSQINGTYRAKDPLLHELRKGMTLHSQRELAVTLLYQIWCARNLLVFERNRLSPSAIFEAARQAIVDRNFPS